MTGRSCSYIAVSLTRSILNYMKGVLWGKHPASSSDGHWAHNHSPDKLGKSSLFLIDAGMLFLKGFSRTGFSGAPSLSCGTQRKTYSEGDT